MTNIPQQQARKRFRSLPPSIQDVIFSVQTAEIIRKVSEENNLPKEKVGAIAEAAGLALLGYVHPEDTAKEIEERAQISLQAAQPIADSLNKKVFAPLRAELEKIYAPAPHDHELEEAPRIIEEIRPPQKVSDGRDKTTDGKPSPAAVPTPKPFDSAPFNYAQGKQGKPSWLSAAKKPSGAGPIDIRNIFGAKPTTSGTKPPSTPTNVPSPTPLTPKPPTTPKPSPTTTQKTPATTPSGPASEFSRLGLREERYRAKPPVMDALPREESEGIGPKILHEEEKIKPGPATSFKIEMPMPKFSDVEKSKTAPPKPAVIGFGVPRPPVNEIENQKPVRVVNYTDLRTSLVKESGLSTPTNPNNNNRQNQASTPASTPTPTSSISKNLLGNEKMMHGDGQETRSEKRGVSDGINPRESTQVPQNRPNTPPTPPQPPLPAEALAKTGTPPRPHVEPPPIRKPEPPQTN